MLIECLLGATTQNVSGTVYNFAPDRHGRFVCDIINDDHVPLFTALEGVYRKVTELASPVPPAPAAFEVTAPPPSLYGSSRLPAVIEAYGKTVQLGDLVRDTFTDSGLTVDAWNALANEDRDERLEVKLRSIMYADQGSANPFTPVPGDDLEVTGHSTTAPAVVANPGTDAGGTVAEPGTVDVAGLAQDATELPPADPAAAAKLIGLTADQSAAAAGSASGAAPAPAASTEKSPLDHDGDGRPGGAAPAPGDKWGHLNRDELRVFAKENGVPLGQAKNRADIVALLDMAGKSPPPAQG
jgi:hypothetical protein